MYSYTDDDGSFIIESGSNAVPVFKVTGNVISISGSLIPAEVHSGSAITELGSIDYPWKELYVESASINFVDTSLPSGHTDRKTRFSKKDVDDLKEGKMPDGALPLSRFVQTLAFEGRIGAVNTWYYRGRTASGNGGQLSAVLATSDPNGTNITAIKALTGGIFVTPRDLTLLRITCNMVNQQTDDNIIVTLFKGATANNSNAVVGLTRIGSTFTATMGRLKTYSITQTLTSGNTLDAGEFLLVTAHTTSFSKTSYPNIIITLDGQYR
jgi:hypothetical protein